LVDVPSYDTYFWPIIERLRLRGGSMTIDEMADDVPASMGLSDEQRAVEHGRGGVTEVEYRLAWARTYLKKAGVLENSARGVWRLTPPGLSIGQDEVAKIPRAVQQSYAGRRGQPSPIAGAPPPANDPELTASWNELLLERLLAVAPDAFERLCQRLLRESGFTKVEVTGRTGDGGIDGTGVLRVNLLSFHVLFQCKRWRSTVGPAVVRDFRGAMMGRADKGLVITTGTFTADARKEATRDGAPAIDLIDGEALCELMKTLRIGVSVRMVEEITVDEEALATL
jgi:restriction system protein